MNHHDLLSASIIKCASDTHYKEAYAWLTRAAGSLGKLVGGGGARAATGKAVSKVPGLGRAGNFLAESGAKASNRAAARGARWAQGVDAFGKANTWGKTKMLGRLGLKGGGKVLTNPLMGAYGVYNAAGAPARAGAVRDSYAAGAADTAAHFKTNPMQTVGMLLSRPDYIKSKFQDKFGPKVDFNKAWDKSYGAMSSPTFDEEAYKDNVISEGHRRGLRNAI